MRFKIVSLCVAFLLTAMAVSAQAQVSIEGINWKTSPLEPGSLIVMAQGTQTGSATLGDGHIVFKFELRDVDPIADDASDVIVQCVLIQNLGTATGGAAGVAGVDIVQVMLLDQDSNGIALAAPVATGTAPTGNCASLGQTNNPGNAQIRFENFFPISFTIPDDGSEIFQVAVRVNDSVSLSDNSQNHTVMLQVMMVVQETVGSPPQPTTFTAPTIMDSMPDVVWNGGINKFTEDTWVVNPLMPGDEGVVSRFTVCDDDANAHELILDNFFIRQGERGTANSSDLTALNLYRIEGFTRSLVASRTVDDSFNRSGQGEGLRFPGAGSTAIVIPDDKCMTFELEAKVSQFATKMHLIQPRIKISAREPRAFLISPDVDPEIATSVGTMIGKGGLVLPDTKLIGKPGIVPVQVRGVQLPGLGTLQIGPKGRLQYNPRVINIKSIRGVAPYIVDATEIDNRLGEARFTVRIDPTFDANGDGFPDDTRLTGVQDGTIANIFVEPTGNPGDGTRLVLTFDCFELVGQMNCVPTGFPFPETPNQNPNNDIVVEAGVVMLLHPGDIDFDGQPTIADALKVANALLSCTDTNSTTTTTSSNNGFATSPERVTWTNGNNVEILATALGNNLVKNAGGSASWDAGASSVQAMSSGDGFVETTASETNTDRMFGLSRGDTDQNFTDIDFAIFLRANSTLEVRRGGQVLVPDTAQTYRQGDVLRVETVNGDVRFKKNGATFLTLSNVVTSNSYPLRVDTALFTNGATLINVVVGSLSTNSNGNSTRAINSELTDEQLSAADVAAPFAGSNEIPDCSTLTSGDVAEIARLAINFGTSPAPSAAVASVATPQAVDKPWYSFLGEMWNWLTGAQQDEGALVTVDFDADVQTLDVIVNDLHGVALGGIQGRLVFDPATVQVNGVRGVNGYVLMASDVDNMLGEVRFIAIAPKGQATRGERVLQLSVNAQTIFNPTLNVQALVDQDAVAVPFNLKQDRAFSAQPILLQLNNVQALAAKNGAFQFRAEGAGIAGIQVQVYDLAGGKLFDQEVAGNSLMFQPLTTSGNPLANGVYLYVITAKGFQNETIRSNINKLAILR